DRQALDTKLASLGWDPLAAMFHPDDDFDLKVDAMCRLMSHKPIGQMLMDQSIIAGCGNYIRSEGLYAAKISPWRPSNSLTSDESRRLFDAIEKVMKDSYAHQG